MYDSQSRKCMCSPKIKFVVFTDILTKLCYRKRFGEVGRFNNGYKISSKQRNNLICTTVAEIIVFTLKNVGTGMLLIFHVKSWCIPMQLLRVQSVGGRLSNWVPITQVCWAVNGLVIIWLTLWRLLEKTQSYKSSNTAKNVDFFNKWPLVEFSWLPLCFKRNGNFACFPMVTED